MKTGEARGAGTARRALRDGALPGIGAAALLAGLVLWTVAGAVALGALELGGASAAAGLTIPGSGLVAGLVLIAVGQSILVVTDLDGS